MSGFNMNIPRKKIDEIIFENIQNSDKVDLLKDFSNKETSNIVNVFQNNINNVLNKYGNIFTIDIEKLTKGTTYIVTNKAELMNLISEDINLIKYKQIITSRLCIIFYRLTYFDIEASKVAIGNYFREIFGKSESFKFNLNRNTEDYFFTNLNNRIFKGYKIINHYKKSQQFDIFDFKIDIAKKLLANGVNKKIVLKSLELPEKCIDFFIYGIRENKLNSDLDKAIQRQNNAEYGAMLKQLYLSKYGFSSAAIYPTDKSLEIII